MAYRKDIEQIEREIKEKEQVLLDLKAREEALEAGEPRTVAEFLHDTECGFNHTDMCGWGYETWEGTTPAGNSTKARWLKKAERFIKLAEGRGIPVGVALELRTAKLDGKVGWSA